MLKQEIDADLKAALLSGDKQLATTLRGLKSAILYSEVAKGNRGEGLSDAEIVQVLTKEAKKCQESADLYKQGGDEQRATAELRDKAIIEKYLPTQLSEAALQKIVAMTTDELGNDKQQLGKIIALVREKTAGQADGATIARLVKERLGV